ncbi:MAG: hypothetical protein ACJ77E_06670 [Gaiellaceae bacterium]
MSSRIGRGPWARALGALLVPDDTTPEAIRGEELWRRSEVEDLRSEIGQIAARVGGCAVTITAPTIRPRIWEAVTSYARDRGPLAQAVRGELQSMQLEHLLTHDWEEPLIPASVVPSCRCDGAGSCEHVVATTHALAAAVDADPGVLLRWRGAVPGEDRPAPHRDESTAGEGAWSGARVPATPPELRGRSESVVKRLGPSGVHVGAEDLADVLARAYEALASPRS